MGGTVVGGREELPESCSNWNSLQSSHIDPVLLGLTCLFRFSQVNADGEEVIIKFSKEL